MVLGWVSKGLPPQKKTNNQQAPDSSLIAPPCGNRGRARVEKLHQISPLSLVELLVAAVVLVTAFVEVLKETTPSWTFADC